MPFENIVRNRENARNQRFLLLPICFLPIPNIFQFFNEVYNVVANAFNLVPSKILLFDKELKVRIVC